MLLKKIAALMKVAEKQHYHDLLVEYSNDIRKSWGFIKSIINKNKKPHIQGRFKIGENLITSDNELISNKFNDFFINIGPTLAKSTPCVNKSPLSYLGNRLTESIYLAPVSENEIGQFIKSLNYTTAGFDDLNSMCLKISSQFLNFLLKPLTHICNLSISPGIFPESKFLGVIIDNKLSWKDHISFVCRKVARGIGVIIKVRKVLCNESLKCFYYSFIYPYMIYCNQVWGSACKTNIEPLQVLQKRAVRIILVVHPRSPSEPLFTTLKFLNCKNIFKCLIGRLMYRIYHGELHLLHGLFTKNSNIHVHDTRQKCHYHLPLCRTNLRKCVLRYVGTSVDCMEQHSWC